MRCRLASAYQAALFTLALVLGAQPGLARELPEAKELPDAPSKQSARNHNIMLTLPLGLAAEAKVAKTVAAGIYLEGGGGMGGGGGRGSSSTTDHTNVSEKSGGIQAHWTPFGAALTDAFYIEPFLGYMQAKFSSSATGYSTNGSGVAVGAEFGYGWFWSPGINLQVGAGLRENALSVGNINYTSSTGGSTSLKTSRTVGFGASAEIAVGWAL